MCILCASSYGHHPVPSDVSLLGTEALPALGARDELTLLLYQDVLQSVVIHVVGLDLRTLQLPCPICHCRHASR